MAIYRNIQMTFWTDIKIVDEFTPEDRYFYLYLLTNPHTNLAGCYELSVKQASVETGYTADVIWTMLDRFEKVLDVIRYSKKTKEVLLLNWHKFNWSKSPKFQKALLEEVKSIKDVEFKRFTESALSDTDTISDFTDTVSADGEYSMETTVTVSVTDTDTDTDTDTVTDAVTERYGEFQNVILTDDEHQKLVDRFPMDYQDKIEALSQYMKQKGKKYKSHYATILAWSRRDEKNHKEEKEGWDDF